MARVAKFSEPAEARPGSSGAPLTRPICERGSAFIFGSELGAEPSVGAHESEEFGPAWITAGGGVSAAVRVRAGSTEDDR